MKYSVLFLTVLSLFVLMLFNSACKKETDCMAVITVKDSVGSAVANAEVYLYAKVKNSAGVTYTADVTATAQTDNAGGASFTFQLPAIYDIQATKVVGAKTFTGVGIVQLEEGATVNKTVTMK